MANRDQPRPHTPRNRNRRSRSIDDAWCEKDDEEIGTVEDYSSIIFNLHVWSYRLSQQEFYMYERRAQLQQAAQVFDHRHMSLLFRDGSLSRTLSPPAHHWQQQQQQQQRRHDHSDEAEVGEGVQIAGYTASQHGMAEDTLQHHTPLLPRSVHGSSGDLHTIRPRRYRFRWSWTRSGMKVGTGSKHRARGWLGLRMLPVNHPAMVAWSLLMLVIDLTYTAILLPFMFAFDLLQPWTTPYWISVALGFLFFVDVFVVLHRGVVVRYLDRHIYIDNPIDVAHLYVTHGSFWRDLPVALSGPLQLLALIPGGTLDAGNVAIVVDTFLLLRGLRLIKLLLLSRELFFGKMGFRHMGQSLYRSYSLSLVYVLAVLLNWLSCIMLLVARYEGVDNSWLANVKGSDLTTAPYADQYIAAFYWMLISTLTIGYGDISATSAAEQVTVICAVITGVLFIGYAIKSLMDIFVEAALQDEYAQRISTLRVQAGALKVWTRWQDLPPALEEPMFRYFMGPWLTNQVVVKHWGSVLQDLPAQLRGQVLEHLLVVKHKELSPLGVRLLANIPRTAGWHVLSLLQPLPLAPGQQLCWKGEEAKYIWLLQEGSLVELNGVVPELSTIADTPGLVIAFDALTWLQQQRQQQQQLDREHSGSSHHNRGHHNRHNSSNGGSRSHNQHTPSSPSPPPPPPPQQQQQIMEPPPATPAAATITTDAAVRTTSDTLWMSPLTSRTVSAVDEQYPTALAAPQQQQQQLVTPTRGGVFAAIEKEITSSSSSRRGSRQLSDALPDQQAQEPAAAAAAAAPDSQQQHQQQAEVAAEPGASPSSSSSVTNSPSSVTTGPRSYPNTAGPRNESQNPGPRSDGVTKVSTKLVTYTRSYQAVGTSFFWALPLHQLSLAFEGLPQLLDSLEAELLHVTHSATA